MSEDRTSSPSKNGKTKSWFGKIGQLLQGEPQDRDELLGLLRDAQRNELLDVDALAMIEGVMHVSEMQVRDIMIPRSQMVVVELDASPEQTLPVVIASAHSRFPVVGESRDEVLGILLAKDLLPLFIQQTGDETHLNIRDLLRPVVFIPESKRLNVLLKEFRANRNHMAIVVDEYGGVAGLVTIEDVLEQIVGEIEDEHDFEDDLYILAHKDGQHMVKAITPVDDFNEHFGTAFSDEEFDTIGGLVMNAFGHLPKIEESVELDNLLFKVVRADNRRVHLMQVSRIEQSDSDEVEEARASSA